MSFCFKGFDYFSWNTCSNAVVGYVSSDDTIGSHNDIITNCYTWQNGYFVAKPYIITYFYATF